MAVPDGCGGAGRHPGNSPERERGRRRWQRHVGETEKTGGDAAVGGVGILRALQGLRGQHLLSVYLMTLDKETHCLKYVRQQAMSPKKIPFICDREVWEHCTFYHSCPTLN